MDAKYWHSDLLARLDAVGAKVEASEGTELFGPGDVAEAFLIVREGHVRVEHTNATGRSVVLYRVGPGDSCVMTTSCVLSDVPYSAYGYAEGNVAALAVGKGTFNRLMAEDSDFRSAVFAAFSHRIVELTDVIDDLLINRMDQKLAQWLAEHSLDGARLSMTHQMLATELGSAREVMSRILKDFERRGWVSLTRGSIAVDDRQALENHARAHTM